MREKWSAAPRRIAAFDALRGFALVNMAVYHGVYDWVYVFGRPAAWFTQTGNAHIWQQFICWTFILLAGAVFPYGKHAVRRGAVTFSFGFLLTAVTMLVMPSEQILFGVLHLIGAAVLLSALLRRFLDRAPALPGAIASFVLFLFLRSVPMGYLGIGELQLFELPRQLYSVPFLFPLGLPGPGFYSADYFPLIPWIFLFWTGLFLWRFLRPYAEETVRGWPACRPLVWLGRHSLWAYLLHQPVLLGFIFLLSILTGS